MISALTREVENVEGSHTRAINADLGTNARTPWGGIIKATVRQGKGPVSRVILADGRAAVGQLKMIVYNKM